MQPDRILIHLRRLGKKQATDVKLYSHAMDGGVDAELGAWKMADYPPEQLADLARELHQCAQFDADEQGNRHKYRAIATNDVDREVHQWTQSHVGDPIENPNSDSEAKTMNLEEASLTGLVAQQMRHTERLMALTVSSQERIVRDLQQQLDNKDKRIGQLEKRELEVAELSRKLHEDYMGDVSDRERNAERIDKGLDLVIKAGSAMGVQMGILPEGFDPSKAIEQIGALKQTLIETKAPEAKPEESEAPEAAE